MCQVIQRSWDALLLPINGFKVLFISKNSVTVCSSPCRSYHLSQGLIEAQHQSQNGCQFPVHAAALLNGGATVCDPSPGAGEIVSNTTSK